MLVVYQSRPNGPLPPPVIRLFDTKEDDKDDNGLLSNQLAAPDATTSTTDRPHG